MPASCTELIDDETLTGAVSVFEKKGQGFEVLAFGSPTHFPSPYEVAPKSYGE
jgi:hypothetical protein